MSNHGKHYTGIRLLLLKEHLQVNAGKSIKKVFAREASLHFLHKNPSKTKKQEAHPSTFVE